MAITRHKHSYNHGQTNALSKSIRSLNFCSIAVLLLLLTSWTMPLGYFTLLLLDAGHRHPQMPEHVTGIRVRLLHLSVCLHAQYQYR